LLLDLRCCFTRLAEFCVPGFLARDPRLAAVIKSRGLDPGVTEMFQRLKYDCAL
jgi:hypothetical protein